MQPERSALSHIVESVADGSGDVDWDALEAGLPTEVDRRLVRQLRILARIAEVHRSVSEDAEGGDGSESDPGEEDEPVLPLPPPAGLPASLDDAAAGGSKVIGRIEPRATTPIEPSAIASLEADGVASPPAAAAPSLGMWGKVELQEKVGEGTFGEVYRAFDTQLHREIAVKLLRVGTSPDRLVDRMLREGRVLARVRHPNVVVVHGAEVRDGRVGLSMEFIRGATLERLLKTQGTFSAREAALIGQDLCRAVAAVHGAGLVHRDIKAQNVMREEGGRVVLMDFGAGQLREHGARGLARLTGTPLYLAPEVLNGGDATVQSDIYSLGVLLYHLVTGDFPLRAKSIEELRALHAEGRIVRLHDARPDLPDGFVQVVERAIDAEPGRRYPSAGAMVAALRAEHAARPAPVDEWPNRVAVKSRWLASRRVAGAIAAAAIAFVAIGAWYLRSRVGSPAVPGPVRSVAVLLDRGVNGESGVLAAGFAEGLSSALAKIESLNVAQWSTAVRFSNQQPVQAASALQVDAIVRLTVEPKATAPNSEERALRVKAQILHRGMRDLGVESVATSVARLPQGQATMAHAIAKRMGVSMSDRDEKRLYQGTQPVNPEAYVEFVQGLQRSNRRDQAGLKDAVGHFERAVRIDANFAAPYAALSEAYSLLRGNFGTYPAQLATDAALGAATKAIELDETLVYGWVSLGFARFYLEWNFPAAEAAFQRALALNPADAMAHHHYGNFLSCVGRHEEGLQQRLMARERDPNSLIFARGVAWNYFFMRRYADAARELEGMAAVDPENVSVLSLLARTYVMLGRFDEGIAMLQKNVGSQGYTDNIEKLAYALAAAGRQPDARALLARIDGAASAYIKPYDLALVHVLLGEHDTALHLLERAYDERDGTLLLMKVDPRLDDLRSQPRFSQLLVRLGL